MHSLLVALPASCVPIPSGPAAATSTARRRRRRLCSAPSAGPDLRLGRALQDAGVQAPEGLPHQLPGDGRHLRRGRRVSHKGDPLLRGFSSLCFASCQPTHPRGSRMSRLSSQSPHLVLGEDVVGLQPVNGVHQVGDQLRRSRRRAPRWLRSACSMPRAEGAPASIQHNHRHSWQQQPASSTQQPASAYRSQPAQPSPPAAGGPSPGRPSEGRGPPGW